MLRHTPAAAESALLLSRRSRNKWADFCSYVSLYLIEEAYAEHDVLLSPLIARRRALDSEVEEPLDLNLPQRPRSLIQDWELIIEAERTLDPFDGTAEQQLFAARRELIIEAEETLDLSEPGMQQRLLAIYLHGIEDWGYASDSPIAEDGTIVLVSEGRALVRGLQVDGVPIAEDGTLVLGPTALQLTVARFERLDAPRVLLDHLARIDAGIAADPAAAIGSAKELIESVCKLVLDDYSVAYGRGDPLPDLYKRAAAQLGLVREAVPESAKGSAAAKKVLQNLMTTVQGLAEIRNELGLGHGRAVPSPALTRHARLAANSAITVVEFVLETWRSRKNAEGG